MTRPSLLRRLLERRGPDSSPDDPAWPAAATPPWAPLDGDEATDAAVCNICRWSGPAFGGVAHSESATCPRCGSIARDRFLFFCMQRRCPPSLGARVLETSPRMGNGYRDAMSEWFDYTCSDFDESMHVAMVKLDLQAIDLDDAAIEILLTPHVLEHVPDTDRALTEIVRILAPGGRMYLQVPVLQGVTAPPTTPEFHGDDTPVFWRFGFDLTARLRDNGFETALLTTSGFDEVVRSGAADWHEETSGEFDVPDMLAGVVPDDLEVIASADESRRHGFEPGYMFLTWECVKPV